MFRSLVTVIVGLAVVSMGGSGVAAAAVPGAAPAAPKAIAAAGGPQVGAFVCGRAPLPLLPGAPRERWCRQQARASRVTIAVTVDGSTRVPLRSSVVGFPVVGPTPGVALATGPAAAGQLAVAWRLAGRLTPGAHRITVRITAGSRTSKATWTIQGPGGRR